MHYIFFFFFFFFFNDTATTEIYTLSLHDAPPILQHAWDQASRRDLARARPHLSLFAYLLELGFARTALEESFRLPAEVADFLHRHVYAHDGIAFHSQNRQRL